MAAMTPIKDILIIEDAIFYVDYAGKLAPAASVGNKGEAVIVAQALARWHKKTDSVYMLNPESRMVLKLPVDKDGR